MSIATKYHAEMQSLPNSFQAKVLVMRDDYPFGMETQPKAGTVPGQVYVGAAYRYGFNGIGVKKRIETTSELQGIGDSYDFGARIYDPRVGRWWSRDDLEPKYPSTSTDVFVANNPITMRELDGKDWEISIDVENRQTYLTFNGKLIDETGQYDKTALDAYAARIASAYQVSFSGTTATGWTVTTTANIVAISNASQLKSEDHALRIRTSENMPGKTPESIGEVWGNSRLGGKYIYINSKVLDQIPAVKGLFAGTGLSESGMPTLERTATHEGGHTAKLYQPCFVGSEEGDFCQGNPALGTHQIPANFLNQPNLMWESTVNGSGNPLAEMSLIPQQLSSIVNRIQDTKKGVYKNRADDRYSFPVNNGSQKLESDSEK